MKALGLCIFGRVAALIYLGSLINARIDTSLEIRRRIPAANRCYFCLLWHFQSRNPSRQTKISLYKSLVCHELTYSSQSCSISRDDEWEFTGYVDQLKVEMSGELYELLKEVDIAIVTKLARLTCSQNVRMTGRPRPETDRSELRRLVIPFVFSKWVLLEYQYRFHCALLME